MSDYDKAHQGLLSRYHGFCDAQAILHFARVRLLEQSVKAVIFGEWYKPYRLLCDAQRYLAGTLRERLDIEEPVVL